MKGGEMVMDKAQEILNGLTSEEKIALQTGVDQWSTLRSDRVGLPSIRMSDGPHGLRKVLKDGSTAKAVCFPTASKLACSFDRKLMSEVGQALGDQCVYGQVDILLGPGVNIKRDVRCGRNFEYFSEDPYLAGELATQYVRGVTSRGVGVSLKHFAANSQEYQRMISDSCIDEKALHEIYLEAFRRTVTNSDVWTVMCAYNKLNGQLCSQNKKLLTDILRKDWGFEGLVVSDWCAVSDRPESIKAGLDLQMPYGVTDSVKKALEDKTLTEEQLDESLLRIIRLALKCSSFPKDKKADWEKQHLLARRASAESTVLVKNSCGILPLTAEDSVAVIGQLAENPHYEGGGSSEVNSYRTESLVSALKDEGISFEYAMGYDGRYTDEHMLAEARRVANDADKVILVVGTLKDEECEGYDRVTIQLTDSQLKVIDAVTNANSNVIAVVQSGAPVALDWIYSVKAVLLDYLGGEAQGSALLDVLTGKVNPSGRVAETWPIALENQPTYMDFATDKKVLYKESVFVGYRYYDTADIPVRIPFGFGLGYSEFEYSDIKLSAKSIDKDGEVTVRLKLTNKGRFDGKETVQIYVGNKTDLSIHPLKQLKAFEKVFVKAGQTKQVSVNLPNEAFKTYDVGTGKWVVNGGEYTVYVGRNVSCQEAQIPLTIKGDGVTISLADKLPCYYDLSNGLDVTDSQFEKLYGQIPDYTRKKHQPHTKNSTFAEIKDRLAGRLIYNYVKKQWLGNNSENSPEGMNMLRMLDSSPLRVASYMPQITDNVLDGIVMILNGKVIRGAIKLKKHLKKLPVKNKGEIFDYDYTE